MSRISPELLNEAQQAIDAEDTGASVDILKRVIVELASTPPKPAKAATKARRTLVAR